MLLRKQQKLPFEKYNNHVTAENKRTIVLAGGSCTLFCCCIVLHSAECVWKCLCSFDRFLEDWRVKLLYLPEESTNQMLCAAITAVVPIMMAASTIHF